MDTQGNRPGLRREAYVPRSLKLGNECYSGECFFHRGCSKGFVRIMEMQDVTEQTLNELGSSQIFARST